MQETAHRDGVEPLTGILATRHASVHARALAAVADCAGERVLVAVVARLVPFLGRAAVRIRRASGGPAAGPFRGCVGFVPD